MKTKYAVVTTGKKLRMKSGNINFMHKFLNSLIKVQSKNQCITTSKILRQKKKSILKPKNHGSPI